MTRRKDTLRNRTERIKITQQKRNSRLEKRKQENQENEKEKLQEINLLGQVAELPTELIRLIYDFMSGNAKMIFFPKYERLNRDFCPFDFEMGMERLFRNMTNMQILDLIYTGTVLKYPEIIREISYSYYYSLIDHDFHTVTGYALLNLWASDKLSYDFVQEEYSMDEITKQEVDRTMRTRIASTIKTYIWNALHEYRNIHRNVCYLASHPHASSLNDLTDSYRDLFLRMEKALYLYRVSERYMPTFQINLVRLQNKPFKTENIILDSLYPFTNELLIPTPLIQT
jgi:hypothetical protein